MSAPWDASQPVDEARAARLVGSQFPELRGVPVRAVAEGWDNSVLLVGDVLFRFPRREQALELQANELAVLPLLTGLPLAVPQPTHVGEPDDDYPWPFWGGPMLPGDELAVAAPADRVAAAEAVGAFLRALHDVDVVLPVDPTARSRPAERAELSRRWLDELAARALWSWSGDVEALVSSTLEPPDEPPVLVHGDLHLRHLLVAADGSATGVIDWGDTCLADPSVDLSLLYAAFSGRARDAALAAYGPVPEERELRARALAVNLAAALAGWAAAHDEQRLLAEYLRGIDRAVS